MNILTPIDENYPLLENATPDQVDENISNGALLFNSLFDDLKEKMKILRQGPQEDNSSS